MRRNCKSGNSIWSWSVSVRLTSGQKPQRIGLHSLCRRGKTSRPVRRSPEAASALRATARPQIRQGRAIAKRGRGGRGRDPVKVAQHFSAGSAFKRCVRPVRDDRNDSIQSFMPFRQRTRTMVDRPCRDVPFLEHQPSNKLLGYFHRIPSGSIHSARIWPSHIGTHGGSSDARLLSVMAQTDLRYARGSSVICHLSFVIQEG
jgi:hypothetical protein